MAKLYAVIGALANRASPLLDIQKVFPCRCRRPRRPVPH